MFNLIAKNRENQIDFNNDTAFTITSFEGLDPADVYVVTDETSLIDGANLNNVKVNPRVIMLSFVIEYNVEYNRLRMYKVFQQKRNINFEFEGDHRHVTFDAIVQSLKVGFFEMKQTVDVTLYCAFPYFKDAQEVINEMNQIIGLFHFPFHSTTSESLKFGYIDTFAQIIVDNQGDVECGLQIELYARNEVINPKVYNYITQEYIGVNFKMETGDLILIDTQKGQKTIELLRKGIKQNLFNAKMPNITWLQLEIGSSAFIHQADKGVEYLTTTIRHTPLYGGV